MIHRPSRHNHFVHHKSSR